jgi:hypothetical protein
MLVKLVWLIRLARYSLKQEPFAGLYFLCNPLIYITAKSAQFVKTPNVLNVF